MLSSPHIRNLYGDNVNIPKVSIAVLISLSSSFAFADEISPYLDAPLNEEVECNTLNRDIIYSDLPYSCYEIIPNEEINPNMRATNGFDESQTLSKEGLPTRIILNNKGGYAAKLLVHYRTFENGQYKFHKQQTGYISVGRATEIYLPKEAAHVAVNPQLSTQVFWQPIRDIAMYQICQYNNDYFAIDGKSQIMQIDVWGTTFHSKWSDVHPYVSSYYKNTNPNGKHCW